MKNAFLLIGVCLSILSCTSPVQDNNCHVIEINESQYKDWASLVHIDSIIPLELNDTSLLSIATKCLVSNERILFWDYKTKQVYAYNRDGRFLFTVGRQGGAASEYIELRDVIFSEDNSKIELLDPTGILIYSADNGCFIEKKKIETLDLSDCFRFMHCQGNDYLFFMTSGEYSIYKVENEQLEGLRARKGYQLICNRFLSRKDECLIVPDYGNFIIDTFHDGEIHSKYKIDFGSKSLPIESLPETSEQFDKVDHMNEYFKSIVDVIENEKMLYIRAVGPARTYYDIYWDKMKNQLFSGPADMDMGLVIVASDDTSLYGLVYPDYVSEKSSLYPLLRKYLLEDDSNPLFVKFNLYEK